MLQIDIAKRTPPQRIEDILDGDRWSQLPHVKQVIDGTRATRGVVSEGDGAVHLVGLGWVQDLPDPVDAVDHGMMQVKRRVVERCEYVGAIATHGIVAGPVKSESPQRALQFILEMANSGRCGAHCDVEQVLGCEGRCRRRHGEVTSLAAGVEALHIGENGEISLHGGLHRTNVDFESVDACGQMKSSLKITDESSYPTKGPDFTQPPPLPDGSQIRPAPTTLPL